MGNLEGIDPNAADMSLMGRAVGIGSKFVPGDTSREIIDRETENF